MTMDPDVQYAVKRLLQANISFAALLREAAAKLVEAANYFEGESLAINGDLVLPDFSEGPPTPPPVNPVPPTNVVTSQFGYVPMVVQGAIRATWPQELWTHAADVSFKESSWRPNARANTLHHGPCGTPYLLPDGRRAMTEDSVGLFQVNRCVHGGTVEELEDPVYNARKGYAIYQSQGWYAWYYSATALGLI